MAETLRDPALFQRAVLSFGAPTGPNGFDLDPLNVHMEMKERGPLRRSAAA